MCVYSTKYGHEVYPVCVNCFIRTNRGNGSAQDVSGCTRVFFLSAHTQHAALLAQLMMGDCLLFNSFSGTASSYSQSFVNKSIWTEVKEVLQALPVSYIIHSIWLYPWGVFLCCMKRCKVASLNAGDNTGAFHRRIFLPDLSALLNTSHPIYVSFYGNRPTS